MAGVFLNTEMTFRAPVPLDIEATGIIGRQTTFYEPYESRSRETSQLLTNNELLSYILKNTDIDVLLRTLGNAFFPRSVNVLATVTEVIAPNRSPKGYILINPNTTVSGVVTDVTVFPVGTLFPVGVTNSAPINVSAHGGAAFFLDVTEATAGPSSVDLQTQDPLTGNWTTAQADIFSFGPGAIPVGTYYANVGGIGIDENARLVVNIGGDSMTGSISATLKPALAGTIAGPTVFLGGPDVNTTVGYPLLAGQKETIYLRENTPLFGIAVATTNIRVFELQ
jgi:hypothetical protein